MSNDTTEFDVPDGKLDKLTYSITNLWDEIGRTDNILFGLVVNVGLALLGVAIYVGTSGILSFLGAAWAMLNALGILRWVMQL